MTTATSEQTLSWWRRFSRRVRSLFRDPGSYDRIIHQGDLLNQYIATDAERSREIISNFQTIASAVLRLEHNDTRLADDVSRLGQQTKQDSAHFHTAIQQIQDVLLARFHSQLEGTLGTVQSDLARIRQFQSDQLSAIQHELLLSVQQQAEATRNEQVEWFRATHNVLCQDIGRQAEATRIEQSEHTRILNEQLREVASHFERTQARLREEHEKSFQSLSSLFRDPSSGWEFSPWKLRELEGLIRANRRKQYEDEIHSGRLIVPRLQTQHSLALESNDTKHPRGSKNDNSIALRFNRKLIQLLGNRSNLRFLDLGCAGGGLVRSLLDEGHFAVGLDGSDYPLVNQTGEWATIPKHLFTCDVTKPFELFDHQTGEPIQFDAITAWELMEHIPEADIPGLMANIERHLAPGGYVLFSVATFLDHDPETGVIWHVTIKPRSWWLERFQELGFVEVPSDPIGKYDWLRGSGLCRYDWTEDDGMGFHVALRRASEVATTGREAA